MNRCQKDSDCGDGICRSDGTCADPYTPRERASACVGKTCPTNFFCANGECLPAVPQCKPADPSCIYIPRGAFEPPVRAWWWPWLTPQGPDDRTGRAAVRPDLQHPDYVEVMSTPVVIRLHPIDPEPAVVFNSFLRHDQKRAASNMVEIQGVMRAVRGSDGSPIWTAPKDFPAHPEFSVNAISSIAAGDCLGTGEVCFVTGGWDPKDENQDKPALSHQYGGLIAFGSDGRVLWVNRGTPGNPNDPSPQVWWGGPTIARLLGPTGPAQIVVGNGVYDGATGKTLCPQTLQPIDQVSGNGVGALTAIADIDLDGIPEIITGNNAYKLLRSAGSPTGYVCKSVWPSSVRISSKPPNCPYGSATDPATGKQVCLCPGGYLDLCPDGFPAVANFAGYGLPMGIKPDDPHPQIVVTSKGFLRIQDWTGGILLNPVPLPDDPSCLGEANVGGAPTIADFDRDGLPEIGIAGQGAYVVWKPGKGFIWRSKTRDCSASTGSSVFDFEGKGEAKVVYSDQCFTRIYDGKTGAALIQEKNASCTAYEMPIVADIDGSGRAKILVPNNTIDCHYSCPDWPGGPGYVDESGYVGLKALASPTDQWVNTRSVWNEHTYHVTNVNLDGTLPWPEPNSWAQGQSNSYRQNVQGKGVFSAPDLSVCEVTPSMADCRLGKATVTATVYNGGALLAKPSVSVVFYADFPSDSVLIGSSMTKTTLRPGESEKVTIPWPAPPQSVSVPVRAVVDPNRLVGYCHPQNNAATSAPVRCAPIG